jgi:hypothetical protein
MSTARELLFIGNSHEFAGIFILQPGFAQAPLPLTVGTHGKPSLRRVKLAAEN